MIIETKHNIGDSVSFFINTFNKRSTETREYNGIITHIETHTTTCPSSHTAILYQIKFKYKNDDEDFSYIKRVEGTLML